MFSRALFMALATLAGFLSPAAWADSWKCDPSNSHLEVVVHATADSFVAHLEKFEPEVTFNANGGVTNARLHFHFADLKTGKTKRDAAMHEWQETERYPDGEFELDALEPAGQGQRMARGRLTLHGQTHALQFPVSVMHEETRCAIDGEALIDTRDHALPIVRAMLFLKVDPLVRVRFHLQGVKTPGA